MILLRQDETGIYFSDVKQEQTDNSIPHKESTEAILKDYFNLDIGILDLYSHWSSQDPRFGCKQVDFAGIRILRQDPWENLCSFICSTNNNIKRISQMVENLCLHFGSKVGSYMGVVHYEFPSPEALCGANVETRLRELGFGYRAKYLAKTALKVRGEGVHHLLSLREKPYLEAREALLQYTGVGPKVADCVCLMSLDKHDCVPIDTHVWQVAQREYSVGRKYKTLNKLAYEEISSFYRQLWGPYAGWAQSVIFTADLKSLQNGVNVISAEKTLIKRPGEILSIDKKKIKLEH